MTDFSLESVYLVPFSSLSSVRLMVQSIAHLGEEKVARAFFSEQDALKRPKEWTPWQRVAGGVQLAMATGNTTTKERIELLGGLATERIFNMVVAKYEKWVLHHCCALILMRFNSKTPVYPEVIREYTRRACVAEHLNLLEFVVNRVTPSFNGACVRPLAPCLSGRVPTATCGPSPENFYAWKLVLCKPWRVFKDLQELHPTFKPAYYNLLNT
jgi:hypothetical protein